MERFLIVQMYPIEIDGTFEMGEEPVCSFVTYDEAEEWVNEQPNPTVFNIVDQLEEDYYQDYNDLDEVDYEIEDFSDLDF